MAAYCYALAKITRWGFHEIMEEIPIAAGLQIINAEAEANGFPRYWRIQKASPESLSAINDALDTVKARRSLTLAP